MSRRRRYGWVLVGVLAVAETSCASFDYHDEACRWLELEDALGLEVAARRVMAPPWTECSNLNAPGYYRLHRDAYKVEFWNGARGDSPQLYLRAFDGDGQHLAIQSPQFDGAPNAHLSSDARVREDYDYRLLDNLREYYQPPFKRIEFAVFDAAGRELGRESLKVMGRSGGKFREWH